MARIKGLSEFKVVWKHGLRNSLISVITLGGIYIAILITLGILVEVVFAWPGMGRLLFQGIVFRDFPVVQAVVMISAGIVIASSLLVDGDGAGPQHDECHRGNILGTLGPLCPGHPG